MRENLNWDRSTDWPWQIAKRIFSNLFVINWTEQLQYLWSGCPRVSIPDEWSHRSCLFGERRNFDHSLSGESGKSWRKIQSFTTHDSTSSKWSRFFLDECPNASIIFEKTQTDVDPHSMNCDRGLLTSVTECHRESSACCVHCWLFALF